MNAQSHYQILQRRHMDQVIDLAQTFQRGLRLRDTQIQGLNEAVAGRDKAIAQLLTLLRALNYVPQAHGSCVAFPLEYSIQGLSIHGSAMNDLGFSI